VTTPENEGAYSLAQAIVEEEEKPRSNFRLLRLTIALSFAILLLQLGQIQIAQGQYYRGEANRNRFRLIQTDALRGIVYDRVGEILVRNVPSFRVSIIPADLPSSQRERVFRDLSSLLNVPIDTVVENTSPDVVGRLPQDMDRSVVPPKRKPGLREILAT
jgi:cell division protein FtsI/penicillin-binding protein 2